MGRSAWAGAGGRPGVGQPACHGQCLTQVPAAEPATWSALLTSLIINHWTGTIMDIIWDFSITK